jgi:acetolactate synthase-1/2/3 large subunit
MRIADYIALTLQEHTKNCYMVTGGGSMHLNDAFGKSGMNIIYCHHEQACAMAAEAEARMTNQFAVVNVTTGPGGINALNGVFGAWTDSIPMIVISGQVKRETLVRTYGERGGWRQLGDQEADIVKMAAGITKYAVCVDDPKEVRYHLEKAIYLAQNGRRGPCWIDVPIDLQAMQVDWDHLRRFNPEEEKGLLGYITDKSILGGKINELIEKLKTAQRPVFYLGSGVHASGTMDIIAAIAEKYQIPVVTTFNSNDLLADDNPVYVGRAGTIGNRSGNFVVQSSDLLIVLGSRLNIRLVSYNWNSFAPNAYKVGVDIDEKELNKPTCKIDLKINADLKDFCNQLSDQLARDKFDNTYTDWLAWGRARLEKYPVCLPEYWEKEDTVNPYCFFSEMSECLVPGDIVACADGTACVVAFQAIRMKEGQRVFHNSGCASMGYDLPAAIGAYYAQPGKDRIICVAGDGSIMMNLQELQTIAGNKLPVQIFILNNFGYHSIRQTQRNFFSDNIVGCGVDSGLTFPDFEKIAKGFDFPYFQIRNHKELKENLGNIMATKGRFICEVFLDIDQHFAPKLSSKKLEDGSMVTSPMEDMWPFLSKEELETNILK